MKAVVDRGPHSVSVEEVPDGRVENPTAAVVRITTNICGEDLFELPEGTENENDFTTLSDIFPTGWHVVELCAAWSPARASPSSAPVPSASWPCTAPC